MKRPRVKHLIIDVESVGLHGEAFAVGYVLLNHAGTEIGHGYAACPHDKAKGSSSDREWVKENLAPMLPEPTHDSPRDVRAAFWALWNEHREDTMLWADCAWPVETNFLSACIADDPETRRWLGPYPFNEISTVLLLAGLDPVGYYDRKPSEEPAHHPTKDARQSARLLIENLGDTYGNSKV